MHLYCCSNCSPKKDNMIFVGLANGTLAFFPKSDIISVSIIIRDFSMKENKVLNCYFTYPTVLFILFVCLLADINWSFAVKWAFQGVCWLADVHSFLLELFTFLSSSLEPHGWFVLDLSKASLLEGNFFPNKRLPQTNFCWTRTMITLDLMSVELMPNNDCSIQHSTNWIE